MIPVSAVFVLSKPYGVWNLVMKKQHLPEKICVYCHRPFCWRKKWERVWQEVKYCSKACSYSARKTKEKSIQ